MEDPGRMRTSLHTPTAPRSSSCDGGIVIDLSAMRSPEPLEGIRGLVVAAW
jgi:hypothetical protein